MLNLILGEKFKAKNIGNEHSFAYTTNSGLLSGLLSGTYD